MFDVACQIVDETQRVAEAERRASLRSLSRAAFAVRKTAMASIETGAAAAPPGSPPRSRRGQLRRAIRYDVDQSSQVAVIGPTFSVMGEAAEAHEFGGEFRGDDYPARPFMGPALTENLDAIPTFWSGSVTN